MLDNYHIQKIDNNTYEFTDKRAGKYFFDYRYTIEPERLEVKNSWMSFWAAIDERMDFGTAIRQYIRLEQFKEELSLVLAQSEDSGESTSI